MNQSMSKIHQLLASCCLVVSASACIVDTTPPIVEGPHYSYVVSDMRVATNHAEAKASGFDLDSDGYIDNQLGDVFGLLFSQKFDVQPTLTESVRKGTALLAVDVQTPDLSNAEIVGVQLLTGITASPSPCANSPDTTCGRHLDGHGSLVVNAASDAMYSTGPLVDDILQSKGGIIPVRIALDASNFIDLNLHHARIQVNHITKDGATAILAGALTTADKNNVFVPQVAAQFRRIAAAAHCERQATTTKCSDSPRAERLLNLFDANHDLMITDDELRANSLVQSLLSEDVTIDNVKYLSFGVSVKLVPAALTYR
jgi:hypothetical protein